MENRLYSRKREKVGTMEMPPQQLVKLCMKAAKKQDYKLNKLLSGRALEVAEAEKFKDVGSQQVMEKISDRSIRLSWSEALGLGLAAMFLERLNKNEEKLRAGVRIDDAHQNESELLLSDGFIGNKAGITPFQQVMAQNLLGKNQGKRIEPIVKDSLSMKFKKRKSYNFHHGLIVSIFQPPFSRVRETGELLAHRIMHLGYHKIFYPTVLIIYRNDLSRCSIFLLEGDNQEVIFNITNHTEALLRPE